MFYALIRKELWLHRMTILVALSVVAVTEVLLPSLGYFVDVRHDASTNAAKLSRQAFQALYQGSGIALAITVLLASAFGGGSTALERRERWIDLAAMLPVSRVRRFAAAAMVAGALALAVYAFHAAVLWSTYYTGAAGVVEGPSTARHLWTTGTMTIAAFGLSRLACVWLRGPALLVTIVCGALASGLTLATYAEELQNSTRWNGIYAARIERRFRGTVAPSPEPGIFSSVDYTNTYLRSVAFVGALALVASFPIAARRVEP